MVASPVIEPPSGALLTARAPFLSSLLSQSQCPGWVSAQQSSIQEHKIAGLFLCRSQMLQGKKPSGPQFQRASPWRSHLRTKNTRPRLGQETTAGSDRETSPYWHLCTPAQAFIRKAKLGIIITPPQRRTVLERQRFLPAWRDVSQKAAVIVGWPIPCTYPKSCKEDLLPISENVQQQHHAPSSQPWFCCRGSSSTFEVFIIGRPISQFSTLLEKQKVLVGPQHHQG